MAVSGVDGGGGGGIGCGRLLVKPVSYAAVFCMTRGVGFYGEMLMRKQISVQE